MKTVWDKPYPIYKRCTSYTSSRTQDEEMETKAAELACFLKLSIEGVVHPMIEITTIGEKRVILVSQFHSNIMN